MIILNHLLIALEQSLGCESNQHCPHFLGPPDGYANYLETQPHQQDTLSAPTMYVLLMVKINERTRPDKPWGMVFAHRSTSISVVKGLTLGENMPLLAVIQKGEILVLANICQPWLAKYHRFLWLILHKFPSLQLQCPSVPMKELGNYLAIYAGVK